MSGPLQVHVHETPSPPRTAPQPPIGSSHGRNSWSINRPSIPTRMTSRLVRASQLWPPVWLISGPKWCVAQNNPAGSSVLNHQDPVNQWHGAQCTANTLLFVSSTGRVPIW